QSQGAVIRCDIFTEEDQTGIAIPFRQIPQHLIVCPVFFNDVEDMLKRRILSLRAGSAPVVGCGNTARVLRQRGRRHLARQNPQRAFGLSRRIAEGWRKRRCSRDWTIWIGVAAVALSAEDQHLFAAPENRRWVPIGRDSSKEAILRANRRAGFFRGDIKDSD